MSSSYTFSFDLYLIRSYYAILLVDTRTITKYLSVLYTKERKVKSYYLIEDVIEI